MVYCQFLRELVRLAGGTEDGFERSAGGAVDQDDAKLQRQFRSYIKRNRVAMKDYWERNEAAIEPGISKEADKVEFLESSPHNEVSKNGSYRVIIDFYVECGALEWDATGKKLLPGPNLKFRTLFMYGDMLSMDHFDGFVQVLYSRICDSGHAANAAVIMLAHAQFTAVWGELHLLFHMIAAIYRMVWGEFLEAIVLMLGMKRIGRNSIKYHQTTFALLKAVYFEVRRRSLLDFPLWIQEKYGNDQDTISYTNAAGTNNLVSFDSIKLLSFELGLPVIHRLYLEFREAINSEFGGLGSFLFQLMDHVSMILLFEQGIKQQKRGTQ